MQATGCRQNDRRRGERPLNRLLSSTVARLVVAIFVLQLVSSGAAMWLLYRQMEAITFGERMKQVADVRDVMLAGYRNRGVSGIGEIISYRRKSAVDPLKFVLLEGPGFRQAINVTSVPQGISENGPVRLNLRQDEDSAPVAAHVLVTRLDGGYRLVVGAYRSKQQGLDLAFAEAIGLTLVLTIALATTSALGLGISISRRTHTIAQTAEALAAGDFSARVELANSGDGFDHLRNQINTMAERIAQLMQQLGTVSVALAHDLRSPVARLRASVDTAIARTEDAGTAEALITARNDIDVLQRMLSAALDLNQLESGAIADRRLMIDVGEAASDLAELYEPLAESQGITLTCRADPVRALADREMLSRAIANLIDNALKYGGRTIVVDCHRHEGVAVISVTDDGPGIAEADLERALRRFGRLDNARTLPGAGLGLAMASAVAQIHGGRLDLKPADAPSASGLCASLHIPASGPMPNV